MRSTVHEKGVDVGCRHRWISRVGYPANVLACAQIVNPVGLHYGEYILVAVEYQVGEVVAGDEILCPAVNLKPTAAIGRILSNLLQRSVKGQGRNAVAGPVLVGE